MTNSIPIDCPGNKPYAASSLIVHKSGLVLGVSRKYDLDDIGLPGGKIDPGENFADACIRETFEETGLTVISMKLIYGDYCGNPEKHVVHWNQTFICKAVGTVQTTEKGRVVWIPMGRLIMKNDKDMNSFGDYNMRMLARLTTLDFDLSEWYSDVELDESKILKYEY